MNIKSSFTNFLYALLALTMLAACSSDDALENTQQPTTQGQTLTINASTNKEVDSGTRTCFGLDTNGKFEAITSKWESTDKVYVFGNSSNKNKAEFSVASISTDGQTATLQGTIPTALKNNAKVNAYIANEGVVSVNDDNQLEVDYSDQDGTWQGAVKKSVLYGSATYKSENGDNIPDLQFSYKTAFFKLTLDFNDATLNNTASLCITGDKLSTKSRINTVYNNGGGTNMLVDAGSINIKSVTITNGKADVYFALYPQTLSNTKILAELADGTYYTFDVTNGKSAQINNGYFYQFGRIGTKIGSKNNLPTKFEGEGNETNPYKIGNILDLMKLQKDVANGTTYNYDGKHFKLTSDITINGEWAPIGDNKKMFCGIFDGDGHSINGTMKFANLERLGMAGFFGCVGKNGVIKNLTNKANIIVENSADASSFVGSIVGRIRMNVTILNCANKGNIMACAGNVGGIVGEAWIDTNNAEKETRIEACYNTGDVINTMKDQSSLYVGGVIAHSNVKKGVDKFVIIGCYNKDNTISGDIVNGFGGGIVGCTNGAQTANNQFVIKSCWNSTESISVKTVGLIAGSGSKSLLQMSYCWAKGKSRPLTNSTHGEISNCYNGKNNTTTGELKDCISALNTAWASSVYQFDENGNIIKK